MGSAELVLSEIKLGGVPSVAKRIDDDPRFAQSVMTGIGTGDSLWLEVARKLTVRSAAADASMAIALASALPRAPARVLALLGRKYPVEEVCSIPFLEYDSTGVRAYHDSAASALGAVDSPGLLPTRDACRARLDDARDEKLTRIAPSYIVKNKPKPAPKRRARRR
jgi:hypothetical protein